MRTPDLTANRGKSPMTAILSQQPTTDWVLTLRSLSHAPVAESHSREYSAEVDEEGLATLLAEIVRALLQRSPREVSADRCEAPALSFL
jgi:hypothetical protein